MHSEPPLEDADGTPAFDPARVKFGSLAPMVDLIYGAVIGYPILLFGDLFRGFLDPALPGAVPWVNVALVAFVFLYSLSDAVEARLMTECFPYRGRGRFSVDIAVALSFFLSFAAAAKASPNFLVPFAVIFLLGAVWGVYLHHDTKDSCRWQYPKAVVLSHFAAAVIWSLHWLSLYRREVTELTAQHAAWIWGVYLIWLAIASAGKEIARIPAVEADLFPTSLIDIWVRKAIRFFRD